MGQIVRRKKKGRPSKADLARRSGESPAKKEADIRRSLRRRNVRYNIDYDDYLDEDDEDEEEDERRREKKLKLVVKLNQGGEGAEQATSQARSSERGEHAPGNASEDEEEEEDESDRKPLKKRRINGGDDDDEDDRHGAACDDDDEEDGRKVVAKRLDSVAGTPDPHSAISLPDKKTLELILDKLQKKDTYGVYAEPVDPEELPDYHDVIEHPMDFATVRKKLANGSYSTLEQFESDVFLICSNAMQYNAPETVYHKQARAIQELARKKFERLRIELECSEKEQKLVQKMKTNSLVKKPTKKPLCRTLQETVGSDFSSGATLATAADIHSSSNPTQAGGCERPGNTDGPVDGNLSLNEATVEKAEEMSSGKGLLSKLGRKSFVLDENRRATYNISNEPVIRSESVFTTFECETKQLVAVGLQTEYSYARSLARFAATLGPVAWKVASQRIQQALPDGYKFGRGWVGEYEPLPTPVLMLENHAQKHSGLVTQFHSPGELRKDDRPFKTPVPVKEHVFSGPTLEGRQSLFSSSRGPQSEVNPSVFGSAGIKPNTTVNAIHQQQNLQSRNFAETENKVPKQVELNSLPSVKQNRVELVSEKKFSRNSEAAASKSRDTISRRPNLPQSVPFKSPDANGGVTGGLPNGKRMKNCPDNSRSSPSDSSPNQMAKAEAYLLHGPDRGVNDPVQLMRMLAEKTQKQQKSSDQSSVHTDTRQVIASVPSVRRDDPNNAAAAAARAWMSIGAGAFKQPATENSNPTTPKSQISADSLYNPTREVRPQVSQVRNEFPVNGAVQFQSEKNRFPVPGFLPQPVHLNEAQFHNRPIIFPQLAAADLSRFQMLPPWRGLSPHSQARQKQEMLPPDLNIGFQSPGSPVKQSGVLVDSQQPDLALQL